MDTLKTTLEHESLQALRQDPALQSLMERLPGPVRDSFTEEQFRRVRIAYRSACIDPATRPGRYIFRQTD
jgi:hypothetical protein